MKKILCIILLLALAAPLFAAQGDPAPAPGREKEQVRISLSGVNLHSLVLYISGLTGKPVLLPDRFPGDRAVDVVSSGANLIAIERAIELIGTAFRSAGYLMIEKADYIQIVAAEQAEGVPVQSGVPGEGLGGQSLMTLVVDVRNADASRLVPILQGLRSRAGSVQVYPDSNKLIITEQGAQLRAMLDLVRSLDTSWTGNVSEIVRIEKSSTDSLQAVINAFVKSLSQNAEPLVQKRLQALVVHAHAPTNSFVLFGHPEDIARVRSMIQTLDSAAVDAVRGYHTYFVLNRDATEMVAVLNSIFAAMKTRGGGEQSPVVIPDPVHNAIVVITTPDRYAELQPLIRNLDRPKAQVLIESALVELSLDKLLDLGVELATLDQAGDNARGFGASTFGLSTITAAGRVPVLPPEGGLTAGIFKDSALNIAALLRLTQADSSISFIAAPRIMASDNKPAIVKIAEEREYQKSIVTPEGRTSEVTHGGYLEAAITLEIVPHINDAGSVRLEIKQVTEQFLPSAETPTGPLTNKTSRMAQTEVNVPEGHTVVIAGLTRTVQVKAVRKVPLLGSIPYLGFFFRRTTTNNEQRNLCVFITPYIFRTNENLAAETSARKEELRKLGLSSDMKISEETLEQVTGGNAPTQAPAPK